MKTEPARILLNGLGGAANLVLIALALTGAITLDTVQIGAIVAAIQAVCGLVGEVLRAMVTPAAGITRLANNLEAATGVRIPRGYGGEPIAPPRPARQVTTEHRRDRP